MVCLSLMEYLSKFVLSRVRVYIKEFCSGLRRSLMRCFFHLIAVKSTVKPVLAF